MSVIDFHLSQYTLFPYERRLAGMEITALTSTKPTRVGPALQTPKFVGWEKRAIKTTYCELVAADSSAIIPLQTRLERSVSPLRTRQRTRYSAHGLHEYKGKFNPQVVRAVGNIIGLGPRSRILDPFCGSGTVLVEALHNNWHADGLDLNPLAVAISDAKITALGATPSDLTEALGAVTRRLSAYRSIGEDGQLLSRRHRNSFENQLNGSKRLYLDEYLRSWFAQDVLLQLCVILDAIGSVVPLRLKGLFGILLSDQLRNVSHQDDGDLRIRRRKVEFDNAPLVDRFLDAAAQRLSEIGAAVRVLGHVDQSLVTVRGRDARLRVEDVHARYDAIITSPPYAMALPYIDTQRLSLAALGLTASSGLSRLEGSLIGSRDIRVSERKRLEAEIQDGNAKIPEGPRRLCHRLLRGLGDGDGFRRRNLPALLYRYFTEMSYFFREVQPTLKTGAHVVMVVGRNETVIGGKRAEIDTPHHLAEIAQATGYSVVDVIPLEAYQRFGLHAANGIRNESLVILRL